MNKPILLSKLKPPEYEKVSVPMNRPSFLESVLHLFMPTKKPIGDVMEFPGRRIFQTVIIEFGDYPFFLGYKIPYLDVIGYRLNGLIPMHVLDATEPNRVECIIDDFTPVPFLKGKQMEQPIDQIKETVLRIFKEYVASPDTEVTLDTTFTGLGADSLDRVEVFMAFEEAFKQDYPNEECLHLETPREMIAYIARKQGITVGGNIN